MKKNILFAAFAAMFFAAACQQEIEPVDKQETPGKVENVPAEGLVFKAVFEESPVTGQASPASKTVLGDNGLDVLWREHDAITLFDGTGDFSTFGDGQSFVLGTRYQVAEGGLSDDKKTASFTVSPEYTPAAEGKEVYWAFCPYISDAAFDFTNQRLIAWLIRYQKGNVGNFSEQRHKEGRYMNFAVGKTTDPENEAIVFQNILCHLKFTIPADMDGKITRIGVHTGAGDYLTGDQCVDVTGDKPVTSLRKNYGTYASGSTYSSSYLLPDHGSAANSDITPGETFATGSYYMAVMPCELKSGLFVTFETEDGTVFHKDHYSTSTTLLRNKVYDMGELTYNNPVSATGTAVALPYAFSMLQAGSSNGDMTYSNKGSLTKGDATAAGYNGYTYTMASGTIASDKTSGVVLTAQTTCGFSSKSYDSAPYLAYWHNANGHDPIVTGLMTNRNAMQGLPFENFFKLSIPLSEELPLTFNVSVGLNSRADTWGLRDWKLYYSNDDMVWAEVPDAANLASVQLNSSGERKNWVYPFVTFTVTPDYKFESGDVLYLKLAPYGNYVMGGSTSNGVPGSAGTMGASTTGIFTLHSCVAIYDPAVEASETPSGAVLYQGFDAVNGGVDYFFGDSDRKRLAGMANLCGDALSMYGYTISSCYSRPGYAQIGYLKTYGADSVSDAAVGSLTTPALGSAGDFTLSFKAATYRHPGAGRGTTTCDLGTPDNTSIQIEVIGGGTIDGAATVVIENVNTEAWQTIEKTIVGATADTQIRFTSPSGSTYNRWFLDDILVK